MADCPQEKENAVGQFKDYVNTLATIKQQNGERYFLLKKKFYTEDGVKAGWAPLSRSVSSASRQLPSIPAQPQPASGHNSLGWGCPLWPRLLLRLQQTGFCGQSEVRSDE